MNDGLSGPAIVFCEYPDHDLPDVLRAQVLAFLRLVWPAGFTGENRHRDWTSRTDLVPHHLLYTAGALVISHLEIITTTVCVADRRYSVQSPTAVLTFPAFRGEGWSSRLNAFAAARIDASGVDIGVVTCAPALAGFYARFGWRVTPGARIVAGPDGGTWTSEDVVLTRSTSDRSDEILRDLQKHPMRVPQEW